MTGDTNPLIVGNLEAQCDCVQKKKEETNNCIDCNQNNMINNYEDDEKTLVVKELETKTNVLLEEIKKPTQGYAPVQDCLEIVYEITLSRRAMKLWVYAWKIENRTPICFLLGV